MENINAEIKVLQINIEEQELKLLKSEKGKDFFKDIFYTIKNIKR